MIIFLYCIFRLVTEPLMPTTGRSARQRVTTSASSRTCRRREPLLAITATVVGQIATRNLLYVFSTGLEENILLYIFIVLYNIQIRTFTGGEVVVIKHNDLCHVCVQLSLKIATYIFMNRY